MNLKGFLSRGKNGKIDKILQDSGLEIKPRIIAKGEIKLL